MSTRKIAQWERLLPRYKWLVSSPIWVGITVAIALLYPEAFALGNALGVSATEPVIDNPNGQLFMLLFLTSFGATLLLAIGVTYGVVLAWLVRVSKYSLPEAHHALSWKAYPDSWLQ